MLRGTVIIPTMATTLRCSNSAISADSRRRSSRAEPSDVFSALTATVSAIDPRLEF
jgi:hypothetical protein